MKPETKSLDQVIVEIEKTMKQIFNIYTKQAGNTVIKTIPGGKRDLTLTGDRHYTLIGTIKEKR